LKGWVGAQSKAGNDAIYLMFELLPWPRITIMLRLQPIVRCY